jgi:hypothetical protein
MFHFCSLNIDYNMLYLFSGLLFLVQRAHSSSPLVLSPLPTFQNPEPLTLCPPTPNFHFSNFNSDHSTKSLRHGSGILILQKYLGPYIGATTY